MFRGYSEMKIEEFKKEIYQTYITDPYTGVSDAEILFNLSDELRIIVFPEDA